jgi:hypothetical protein
MEVHAPQLNDLEHRALMINARYDRRSILD